LNALKNQPVRRFAGPLDHSEVKSMKSPQEAYQTIQQSMNRKRPEDEINELELLVKSYPDFAVAHNDLGVLYYHTGDKEKAHQYYEKAVQLDSGNIVFQKNLADFYCVEMGRIEDALQLYVSILKTNPQDIETLMATAQICSALEKFDDARDFFNQVLQIEPWNAEARNQILKMEGQMSAASPGAESAEDAYRRLQDNLNSLSPHQAIAELEKLIESHPEFAVGHNDLAVCYYNTGNKEKALHHYQQAAQLQPENITLQKNLADFLFVEQGRVEEALQIYVNILAAHPTDVETLLITGHICVALEKFDDAKDFYERVLALAPENEDARRNLTAIHNRQKEESSTQPDAINDVPIVNAGVETTGLSPEKAANPDAESQTKVSILVSLDGIQNRVKECLKSIQLQTSEPHELWLIDDQASKGLHKWAQQFVTDNDHYHIVECRHQTGWAARINQAMRQTGGDLIVLLHNDVVLPQGWLNAFRMGIKSVSNTGVVGPMSNRAPGIQQLIETDESDRPDIEANAAAYYEHNQYKRVSTLKVSDVCLVFRYALVEKIGNFDEQFVSAEIAVEDFCHRAAAAGCQNWVAADTYVYHYDRHKTPKNSVVKKPTGAEDWRKYKEKWNNAQNPDFKALQIVEVITRADELKQKGQIDQAVETLLVAIGTQPENKRLYYALAEVLLAAKRFQDAKEALNEIPSNNGNPELQKFELLGYAEEGLADFDAARSCVDQLLAINPQHAPALNLMGILAYRNGDRDSAETHFKRAMDADPGYGEPYTNLGTLQLEADRPAEALKSLEKGFRLTPTDLDIATNYHSLVAEMAGYAKAEAVAVEAAVLYPNNQKIKYMLIDFYIQQGKFETAMSEIEDAVIKFGIDDGILAAALKIREKLGPMTIQTSGHKKVPVSVCMIIKNEEKYLARSLASVKPIVDEMIVVDTGSADRSKEIAITFGARVYDYQWENDFAAARNFSISKASGEWIFILDGDEVISPLDYERFHKIVVQKPKAPVAYSITTRNYNPLANIVGWVPNDGKYPAEEAAGGWLPSEKARLFYGKDHIRFEGAVHELVDPVLKRKKIEIQKCSIPVHHYGRLEKEKLDRKGEIYFEIGQKKLSEMGEDVNALRELAIQATILERNQEALDLWQRLLAVNPIPELSATAYVNMGTIYSRLNQFEAALEVGQKALECAPALKEAQYNYAVAELHCGNAPATINALENLLRGFPDYPPAQFILAAAYFCADQKDKGLKSLRHQKTTPTGAHLEIPSLELGQSLMAAKQNPYALKVLGAAIECDIVNKDILELFNTCLQINGQAQQTSQNPLTVLTETQPMNFDHLS
jgi:tetratricopeptide (TPR) repeat protein